nr:reverse transcriptase domain-containing protein [Tanacetum cinerariifolium]GEY49693.1 reverse transcriptase domain-containing protein [Tanacetum cinerariifolium]
PTVPPAVQVATVGIPTGSGMVLIASPIFTTASVVTPYSLRKGKEKMVESDTPKKKKLQEQIDVQVAREIEEQMAREDQRRNEQIATDVEIARIHAEEELQMMIDGLDRNNEVIARHLHEYEQAAAELTIGEKIELINELVKYQDHHSKILKEKFILVWKQIEDFVPMASKEEEERFKRKGLRLEQESPKKMKTSEEVSQEDLKEMMELVPIEEVYVEALQVKHPIIDWEIHTEGQRNYWKIIRLGGSIIVYQFFVDMLKHFDREDLNQLWTLVKETLSIRQATSIPTASDEFPLPDYFLTANKDMFPLLSKKMPLLKKFALLMKSRTPCPIKGVLRSNLWEQHGYAEAIVVPLILAEHFKLKYSLINMMTSNHNTIANPKGELKAITTRSGIVLDGPFVPIPPLFINPKEDERVEETLTDQDLPQYTIKVLHSLVQKPKPPSQRNFIVHQRDPIHPNIPYPSRMHKQKQQEKDEVQIYKFWQMFKQLHINITLADTLILIPKYQKMLKALLSNKDKLLEMANTSLNENCSAVILKKLLEKLGDPGKFLIPCIFSELKCKALADLGACINLMPLSVWKNLGLPELISTRMTLELANRAICTPARIARDVFVLVGKFTFPADFFILDYESDPRVLLILGRPFLRTTRALIDVHGEEMILRDGDERLTLNMRHDTSSYSNQPQKESINMINIYNDSYDIFDPEGGNVLIEKVINLDSTKDLPPPHDVNHLSGSTTSSSSPNHLLEEFTDKLTLITFPPRNYDLPFNIGSNLKEIEYFLNNDPIKEMDSILEDSVDEDNLVDLNDNLADTMPEMFTYKHTLDYSSPPLYDEYDNDLFKVESDTEYVYNDLFDSNGEKIKESKLLIDELDLPISSDFLPSHEYDSCLIEDFSKVDVFPLTDNKDKVFNPGILIQENLSEVNTRVAPDKNVKKIAISHAYLILEDFDHPLYEFPFLKEVPGSKTLLSFSSENEEKVFKLGILTSKGVHFRFSQKISH